MIHHALALLAAAALDPTRPGPYPVGVTTTVLVDHGRTDKFTNQPRTLVTDIWYPATDDARPLPKGLYSAFFPGGVTPEIDQILVKTHKKTAAEIDQIFWNDGVRDARVRPGRHPLIVFSHGNGGTRFQNTFWFDHLVSHGYIIVSADHTANARHTVIDGKVIPYQPSQRLNSADDRVRDMIFLLDEMLRWNRGADSRFAGRIEGEAVGAAGMSFGGFTVVQATDVEPRFKAAIPMAAVAFTNTNVTVPTLPMLGAKDRTIGARGNDLIRAYWEKHQGPAYLLELPHGGHYSFTDIFKINKNFGDGVGEGFTPMEDIYKIINAYSTAFYGVYLKGDLGYLSYLEKNHRPDVLTWKPKNEPRMGQASGLSLEFLHFGVGKKRRVGIRSLDLGGLGVLASDILAVDAEERRAFRPEAKGLSRTVSWHDVAQASACRVETRLDPRPSAGKSADAAR